MKTFGCLLALRALLLPTVPARADDIACISTTFRIVGANDKVCISAFDDPKVSGVACHISQARTGGLKGTFGLAEDPSQFSIACRQVGPISVDVSKLEAEEKVYSAQRVRAELRRIEPDAGHPFQHEPGVLPRSQPAI